MAAKLHAGFLQQAMDRKEDQLRFHLILKTCDSQTIPEFIPFFFPADTLHVTLLICAAREGKQIRIGSLAPPEHIQPRCKSEVIFRFSKQD